MQSSSEDRTISRESQQGSQGHHTETRVRDTQEDSLQW
jgi:hypothetical protein